MSGGSMDYIYGRVNDAADRIQPTTPLRRAFVAHLYRVADALHDIEWVDSGDYATGDEEAAILKCIARNTSLEHLLDDARTLYESLKPFFEEAQDGSHD